MKNTIKNGQLKQEFEFIKATNKHIKLVTVACNLLNKHLNKEDFGTISQDEIETHDISKFTSFELPHYTRQFFGKKDDLKGWEGALMHHYKHNQHHWQHWLTEYKKIGTESRCIPKPMPTEQCLIMVADWLASSLQYTNNADMSDWLNNNLGGTTPKIILHQQTKCFVDNILENIGFWTSCDNAPLYCIIDTTFINLLSTESKKWI